MKKFLTKVNLVSGFSRTNQTRLCVESIVGAKMSGSQRSDVNGHGSTNSMGKIYRLNKNNDNSDIIEKLVKILQQGGVIALPTDTLYGVGCLAQSSEAIEKIYKLKGRDLSKPIAICVGEVYDVFQWGKFPKLPGSKEGGDNMTDRPIEILSDLLPGPVTIVTERTPALNMELNPETQLVGIRVPDHQFIRDLTNRLKEPLALTSANLSASMSPLCIDDFDYLHEKLDAIIDGGHVGLINGLHSASSRQGSTVFRIQQDGKSFKVLRPGCAYEQTVHTLQEKWGIKLSP
uniref:yrdC domain-containing protein, mitochondrial-like n=1 Tax=Styela clava TaxID=7725 RepID=UPI00193A7C84|nr:yrdC domain-containing protein, mitochondrial-like [Styela clava]